jgi:hypothetical protein
MDHAHVFLMSFGPCERRTPLGWQQRSVQSTKCCLMRCVGHMHSTHCPVPTHCLQWTCTSKVAIDRLAITFFYQAAFTEQEAMERSISPLCYLVRAVRIDEHTLAHTSFAVCLTTLICRCWTTTCLGLW